MFLNILEIRLVYYIIKQSHLKKMFFFLSSLTPNFILKRNDLLLLSNQKR